jgi:hypothetical protein
MTKPKLDPHKKRMGKLFCKLVDVLNKKLGEDEPTDVVLKESRQLVKDFGFMLTQEDRREVREHMTEMGKSPTVAPVVPFPVQSKQA